MRLVALLLVCACVQSREVPCDDGRLCPAGNTCDDVNHRCLSPEQTAACAGHAEGEDCTLTGITGVCQGGVCEPLICGDGVRTGTESCDGSDLGGATCKTAGFYEPDGLACTPFCTFDTSQCKAFCGDGIVQTEELCDGAPPAATCVDDGFDAGALGCSVSCGASFAHCGRFGWRAEPTGLDFQASLTGKSSADLWVTGTAGGAGAVAHYDGTAWSIAVTIAGHQLGRIVEVSPDDLWTIDAVTASHAVLRIRGGQATVVSDIPAGTYEDLLALGADDVYVATSDVGILHWNGATWQPVGALASVATPCGFCEMSISGTGPTDLWVAQTDGTLVHWDGVSWQPAPLTTLVKRISATSPTNVWIIGRTAANIPVAARWDGAAWTTYPRQNATTTYISVVALADNDVWIAENIGVVDHYDGVTWTSSGSRMTPPSSTSGFGSLLAVDRQILGATAEGFVSRYAGQLVGRYDTPIFGRARGAWSSSSVDSWMVTDRNEIWHYDGARWTLNFTTPAGTGVLDGMFGSAADNVWAWSTTRVAFHFDGTVWATVPAVGSDSVAWGTSATDMWFFGSAAAHFDGVAQTSVFVLPRGKFSSVSGVSSTEIWAATNAGEVYRWDGAAWTLDYTAPTLLKSLVALGAGEVIAVGPDRRAFHRVGGTWETTFLPVLSGLTSVAGTAPADVFATTGSELVHFDGTAWTAVRVPTDVDIAGTNISGVDVHAGFVDLLYPTMLTQQIRRLVRTRPWDCAATETACGDGVDNDCDGLVDGNDPDCP